MALKNLYGWNEELSQTSTSFHIVGEEWLALMAGNDEEYNAMTIAWGHFCALWEKKIGTKKVRIPACVDYCYPNRNFHDFCVSEVVKVLVEE